MPPASSFGEGPAIPPGGAFSMREESGVKGQDDFGGQGMKALVRRT